MQIEQKLWTEADQWTLKSKSMLPKPQLVFVFGGRDVLERKEHIESVRSFYPSARLVSCSTAGEILGTRVYDNSLCVTAIHFEKTSLNFASTSIESVEESEAKGCELSAKLPHEDLTHVMVFSDGLVVNGTALVEGLVSGLPEGVSVTGGLVGDGANFKQTLVGLDQAPLQKQIVVIGFYGNALQIGFGSLGGWDTFGPDRTVTRSKGNELYELDGTPALDLYKEYLGELASELPGSGLLFPMRLQLATKSGEAEVVRTLLAVNESANSMTFAGDIPEGVTATFMKANFERLIDGAYGAAKMSLESMKTSPDLAILISCVGRKLVLKSRVEEETEAVQSVVGDATTLCGFYSYGEICPVGPGEKQCRLHNQTMTITTFKEV